jgi:hypothetical protein
VQQKQRLAVAAPRKPIQKQAMLQRLKVQTRQNNFSKHTLKSEANILFASLCFANEF